TRSKRDWSSDVCSSDLIPYVAGVTFTIAIVLGIWLGNQYGWWVFVLGLIGILAAAFYSAGKKSLAAIGLGETVGAIFFRLGPFSFRFLYPGFFRNSGCIHCCFALYTAYFFHDSN